VTLLVVIRHESSRYAALLRSLEAATAGARSQVLLVDGRSDAPLDRIWSTALLASHALDVMALRRMGRAHHRHEWDIPSLEPRGDDWVVVIDGDREQPATLVPGLLSVGESSDADLVLASSASRSSNVTMTLEDGPAQRLSHALTGRARRYSDPLDGFFAVRLDAVDVDELRDQASPRSLRSLVARPAPLRVVQLPESVRARLDVVDVRDGAPARLRAETRAELQQRTRRRRLAALARAVGFAAVGATGLVVNSLALWVFVDALQWNVLLGATLATQVSTIWNFVLVDSLVFRGGKSGNVIGRFLGFAVVNNVVLLLRLPVLSWLIATVGLGYVWANVLTLIAAFLARFLISDRLLFRPRSTHVHDPREEPVDAGHERHDVEAGLEPYRPRHASGTAGGAGGGPDEHRVALTA